ncbi:phosphatidylinositol phosphate synthase [Klenkia brasiliensis]|uniref:Phosphatidylinositol phosphate synthase n=1 Tax=Klenkia brasiliensis TaxID=333142 RepID=A0A1G7VI94_9ACTN|nr:CDP-alcohol phosphatidyltransferase family protein [Klenkia brasiliensis]SDG59463.1 CDP-diacylglycerol--glycerol-3-phosphate 3-phosphatidyltransferase [Klenkia brasiliensis]
MLGVNLRPAVARVWAPVVRTLLRAGVTADTVTLLGTVGAVASAVFLIGNGWLWWGAVAVTLFVLLDMLDGALARARGGGSVFGAVLDSTGDRAADAAIFAALAWWFSGAGDNRMVVWLALTCLVLGVLTSYVKARAEGMGLTCDVGLVERTERLILVLVGTGFTGIGIPYALQVCLWVLLVGSTVTVGQRFVEVHRQSQGRTLP